MSGSHASRKMIGVYVNETFNMSEGTAKIAIPRAEGELFYYSHVPINHLRPYVASLHEVAWTEDNPSRADHPRMLRCQERGCENAATHNDGTDSNEYLCCGEHCTCYDKYTSEHILMDTIDVSVGFNPLNQEAFLSESKLRLYWDRVRDLPEKVKGGIEAIRYSEDAPQNVVTYVKDAMIRLRRVFESATEGIPLEVKSEPIELHLKPNAVTKRCPQPILGYGA